MDVELACGVSAADMYITVHLAYLYMYGFIGFMIIPEMILHYYNGDAYVALIQRYRHT